MQCGPSVAGRKPPVQAGGFAGTNTGQRKRSLPAVRNSTVGQAERWHAGVDTAFLVYDTQPLLRIGTQAAFYNDLFSHVVMELLANSVSFLLSATTPNCIRGYPVQFLSCAFVFFVVVIFLLNHLYQVALLACQQ